MGATLAMNLFVSWYEAREGRRLGSEYLIADAAHTRSDVYVSLGVVASFAGARAGVAWIDPLVALAIAVFIADLAERILVGSYNVLTDRATMAPSHQALVRAVPGVVDCRDVRTRAGRFRLRGPGGARRRATSLRQPTTSPTGSRRPQEAHPRIVDVVVHLEPAASR
jgi:cation diffusion facilitator family transporter